MGCFFRIIVMIEHLSMIMGHPSAGLSLNFLWKKKFMMSCQEGHTRQNYPNCRGHVASWLLK